MLIPARRVTDIDKRTAIIANAVGTGAYYMGVGGVIIPGATGHVFAGTAPAITPFVTGATSSATLILGVITSLTVNSKIAEVQIPEVDLLIRTSGEMRISNFLLWEIAYSELHITKTLWPDFRKRHFLAALRDFQGRKRRFGGVQSVIGSVTSWAR